MYYAEADCSTWRETLDLDDISGIQALYPPGPSLPAAPTSLVVTGSSSNPTGGLNLGWVDNASNADGLRIDRSTDGVNFAQRAQVSVSATSYADSGLTAGAQYYYRVYAYNSGGPSGYSNMAWGQTQAPVPTAPTSPSKPSPANGATGVSTTVKLSWTSSGATSYDVYINGYVYASGLTTPSVTVSSLTSGSTNSWQVVAKNSVGATAGPSWAFSTQAAAQAPAKKGKGAIR